MIGVYSENHTQKHWLALQRSCYLSGVYHDKKIRSRNQRTDIGNYSFLSRTIQHGDQLPADALGTVSCKPINLGKRLGK
jgi:hypothetical protein